MWLPFMSDSNHFIIFFSSYWVFLKMREMLHSNCIICACWLLKIIILLHVVSHQVIQKSCVFYGIPILQLPQQYLVIQTLLFNKCHPTSKSIRDSINLLTFIVDDCLATCSCIFMRRLRLFSLSPTYLNTVSLGVNLTISDTQPSVTLRGHITTENKTKTSESKIFNKKTDYKIKV